MLRAPWSHPRGEFINGTESASILYIGYVTDKLLPGTRNFIIGSVD